MFWTKMKTLQVIIRALSTVGLLLFISGCVSYHVTPDHSLQGERGYKIIDTMLKRATHGWEGSMEQIGATDQGWTDIEVVDTEYWSDGYNSATKYYGRAVTYKYVDIEDVSVQAAFGSILFCGIFDPTSFSTVRIKFKDGSTKDLSAFRMGMRLVPFWLFAPEWRRAHNGAKAFQTIVTGLKTNGKQAQSGVNFKADKQGGIKKVYYESGKLQSESNWKDGKQHGITKWYYESGKLKSESNWEDGKQDGIKKGYYESGTLQLEANWKDGKQDGITKGYYESGKLKSELFLKDGKLDGINKMYHESGMLKAEGNWKAGKGITKVYYESGNLQSETNWKDEGQNGTTKCYYESGNLQSEDTLKDGKVDGIKKVYYENGNLQSEENWKEGQKVSATCYDEKGVTISCPNN